MSNAVFDDTCKGCRPILVDPNTMEPLPLNHKIMQVVDLVWAATTFQQRKAFHDFCCLNDHAPENLATMKMITEEIERRCKEAGL